jgi:hypothetical protein
MMHLNFRKTPSLPKEGLLQKRGGFNTSYKLRRCVLSSENLSYFEGDDERGRIPVAVISSVHMSSMPDSQSGCATVFNVVCPNRIFVFSAPSTVEALDWVDTIQALIDERDKANHTVPSPPPAPASDQPAVGVRAWFSGLLTRSTPVGIADTPAPAAAAATSAMSRSLELPDAPDKRARAGSGIGDLLVSLPSRVSPKALGRWLVAFNSRHERASVNRMPMDAMCMDVPAEKIDAFAKLLQGDKCAAFRDECATFVATFQPSLDGDAFRAFVARITSDFKRDHLSALQAAHFTDDDEFYDVAETFLSQMVYRSAMRLFGQKDAALHERIQRLWFVTPAMLDVAPRYVEPHALVAAARELRVIDRLQAPRPILAALLRTCRRIYAAMNAADADRIKAATEKAGYAAGGASADDFVPLLTFVVIKSNVSQLASALNIVSSWRPPELLNGESGYYYVSCAMVASFLENATESSFSGLSKREFDDYMSMPLGNEARSFRHRWGALLPELAPEESEEWVLVDESE